MSSLRNRAETGGEIPRVTRHTSLTMTVRSKGGGFYTNMDWKEREKGLFLPTMEAYNPDTVKLQTLALTSDTKASCFALGIRVEVDVEV
jgi:hypothetical protein